MDDPQWPWFTVPDEARARNWAGRADQKSSLTRMLNRWRRRPKSEINVIWADFGQGKTHTLMHLMGDVESESQWLSHYIQLPPLTQSSPFPSFYRQLMLEFPLERIATLVFDRFRQQPRQLFEYGTTLSGSVVQLLWLIHTRTKGHDIATRWLRGDRVPVADLRKLEIADRKLNVPPSLTKPAECQNALDALIGIFCDLTPSSKPQFVLLIDEFQRLGELPPKKAQEFCNSLHLIYNKHPSHLQLVLAFATGMPETIDSILTADILNRQDSRTGFDALTLSDAETYIKELLSQYGFNSANDEFVGPYSAKGIRSVLDQIDSDIEITPRRINLLFDHLTNEMLDRQEAIDFDNTTKFDAELMLEAFPVVKDLVAADSEES